MSITGSAPRIFARTNSWGLPYLAVLVSFLFSLLSFMNVSSNAAEVFGYFATSASFFPAAKNAADPMTVTSIAGLLTWVSLPLSACAGPYVEQCGILVTFIRYHKGCVVQGIDRRSLPFRAPFQPYLTWYGLAICSVVIFFNAWTVFLHHHWYGLNLPRICLTCIAGPRRIS
jgi:amino acid transporter